ncbi:lipid II:glycine glycyltransferase FemX [Ktedonospora formicarum]|uniref:BioF2-like acetyltransferase domain-containing protein n=1 Tax=Ktedonospora formicarum TaxID=2778364 RepID=A0A8J3HSS1_9CHLR|nr:GNAT family N-acetyltransferase [Ktedonospora formicarum]GHO43292.1 hypothetical protein KSX_14550 [Ktedonospora formicarum]
MIETSLGQISWQTFIEQHKQATFYSQPAWLALIQRVYGFTPLHLIHLEDDKQPSALLPLYSVRSPLSGSHLVSLPFSDQAPLLADNEASTLKLIDEAIELTRQHKARYLELRTGENPVLAEHPAFVESNLYVTWHLALDADPAQVWSHLRKPVQHQIKKARKNGLLIRSALTRTDVERYHQLHVLTRTRKHGMPAQPTKFFYELWDTFSAQQQMMVLLAEHGGQVIAGMVLLGSGKTLRYAYGASDERYLHLAPNNLLMWRAIEWGCEHGYEILDMGRTARDNEGLMEFKRRWGAELRPYHITIIHSRPD